jgi:flagellar hook assembly protein FlgD
MRFLFWILLFGLIGSGMSLASGEVSLKSDKDKIDSKQESIAFTISGYNVSGPVKLQIYSYSKEKEDVLVTNVLCRPAGPAQWKGVWYGKDDLGKDVKNGTYKVILRDKMTQKVLSKLIEVIKFQVISDLAVEPNPYWPAPINKGGVLRSSSKAKISFFLEEDCRILVGIFPPGKAVDTEEWAGAIWMKEHDTIESGSVNFYWEGEVLDENKVLIIPENYTVGDYTAAVKAIDLKDPSNETTAEYVFKVTPIPIISTPLCTPTSFSPNGDNINDYTEITFQVRSPSGEEAAGKLVVAVSIHDATGNRIVYIPGKQVPSGQELVLFWNGTAGPSSLQLLGKGDERQPIEQPQKPLPNGLYSVNIRAADSDTNTLANPIQTRVEIKNPISLMINQFIASEGYVKNLGDNDRLDAEFWHGPDKEWARTLGSLEAGSEQESMLTSKSKMLPLPLLLPDQSYIPWIRYRVNKDANITLEIYSEDGGKEEVLKLGTSRAGEIKRIQFENAFDSLRDGATYRAILIAVEIDAPIKVSDEFWFQVYRAEKPVVEAIDDWKILKTSTGKAWLENREIGSTVEFIVNMIYPADVKVNIHAFPDEEGGEGSLICSLTSMDDLEMLEKRIYWDGKNTDGEHVAEGLYYYEVIASRADKKMEDLRGVMSSLEFKTLVTGYRLWVIALPNPRIVYDPDVFGYDNPASLISPDGLSPDQSLKITFYSDDRSFDVKGNVYRDLKAEAQKVRVLNTISVDEEMPGHYEWFAADLQNKAVPDGTYRVEWSASCKRDRTDPVTRKDETIDFSLHVDPVNVIVDRKPFPSDITVEPEIVSPDNDGVDDKATIRFKIGDDADVTLIVVGDRDSARLLNNFRLKKGFNFIEWNGKNIGGHYFKRWKDERVTLYMLFQDDQGNVRTGNVDFEVISYYSNMAKELSGIDDYSIFFADDAGKFSDSPDLSLNSTEVSRSNDSIIRSLFRISHDSWELKKEMTGHYMTPDELEDMMEEGEVDEIEGED